MTYADFLCGVGEILALPTGTLGYTLDLDLCAEPRHLLRPVAQPSQPNDESINRKEHMAACHPNSGPNPVHRRFRIRQLEPWHDWDRSQRATGALEDWRIVHGRGAHGNSHGCESCQSRIGWLQMRCADATYMPYTVAIMQVKLMRMGVYDNIQAYVVSVIAHWGQHAEGQWNMLIFCTGGGRISGRGNCAGEISLLFLTAKFFPRRLLLLRTPWVLVLSYQRKGTVGGTAHKVK